MPLFVSISVRKGTSPMLTFAFDWIVVISLERRKDRWLRTREQLTRLGINADRLLAVDGRLLQARSLPIRWRFRNPPSRGILGCFLSHLTVLRRIERERINSTLVLEDDILFAPDFRQVFLEYWERTPEEWDLIYLGQSGFIPRRDVLPIRVTLPSSAGAIYRAAWSQSTYALAVRYSAAQVLSSNLATIEKPVDLQIADLHGRLAAYVYTPPIILHACDSDSTLNDEHIVTPDSYPHL